MLFLTLRFLFMAAIGLLVLTFVYQLFKLTLTEHEKSKNIRNFQVRFEPENNKYYIVNVLDKEEVPVVRWYGRRIFYSNKADAVFVTQKLNP